MCIRDRVQVLGERHHTAVAGEVVAHRGPELDEQVSDHGRTHGRAGGDSRRLGHRHERITYPANPSAATPGRARWTGTVRPARTGSPEPEPERELVVMRATPAPAGRGATWRRA